MKYINSLRSIAKGAGIILIGFIISKVIGYLYRIVLARGLGASDYGTFSLAFAIFGTLTTLALLGLNQGILRYVPFYRGKKQLKNVKGTILSSFKIVFVLSIILAALLFIFSDKISLLIFKNPKLSTLLKIFAIIIPFANLTKLSLASLRAFKKVKYIIYSQNITEEIARLLITIILIYMGLGLLGVGIAYIIAAIIVFLLSITFLQKVFPIFKDKLKPKYLYTKLISYSWPLLFVLFLYSLIIWTDTLMLGYFRTTTEVGIYNAAAPTSMMMLVLPHSILFLFLPVISELFAKRKYKAIKHDYNKVAKWVFFANLPLFLLLVLFSKQVLYFFFGKTYVLGSLPLIILGAGYLIYGLFLTSIEILKVLKKTKLILINTIIACICNILLNLYLIPKYGMIGGAIATSISLALYSLLGFFESYKFFKLKLFQKYYLKLIIIGLFSAAVIYTLKNFLTISFLNFILFIIIFLAIYFILTFIFRCVDKEDLTIIHSLKKRVRNK